ncbi:unnamed protein product [Paramecium pentaurelia]|uniref:MORN repeat protein n=1 Tax=Paramecium pentaurelia TaxID=43138 RepID=A0A8S1YE23_9CILI|nr:unnamed protein product [Paramecium pentaurelia]
MKPFTKVHDISQQNINLQFSQYSDNQNKCIKTQNDNNNNNGNIKKDESQKKNESRLKQQQNLSQQIQKYTQIAKPLIPIQQKSEPYKSPFNQKVKNTNTYSNLNESQKNQIKSEQFKILKTIQETLNQGTITYNRIITFEDGYTYEGDYQESQNDFILEGQGVLKYHDEVIYKGQFRNNKFHGNGIIKQDNKLYNLLDWRRKDQSEIKGIFENGILIGEQTMDN